MPSNDAVSINPLNASIPQRVSNHSPRSSIDSPPRTPHSPFLQHLSNRFRKSSNASNVSSSSDPPSQTTEPPAKPDAAQSAKRFVLSIVRDDWDWPPPQPATASGGENVTPEEIKQESVLTQREPANWRVRHEGASDLDLDLLPVTSSGKKKAKRSSDPYKFESPDAIANVIQEQRTKIRRATAEEARWNEGLRTWTERRNAWTAAELRKPKKRSFDEADGQDRRQRTFSPGRNPHKSSRSSEDGKSHASSSPVINGTTSVHSRHSSEVGTANDANGISEEDRLTGPYLPLYPPLFPESHTLRSRIKPAAYPTIYSKVVLQSLTPNIPIPLTHMTGALVDGWKAEGNWPPQTLAEQQQHALLKHAKGDRKGDTAFQKWHREREAAHSHIQDHILGGGFADEEEEEEKKGFRRGISGAVKKVFGMHTEVKDEDGGLAKLGLSFGGGSDPGDDGALMKESRRVAADNVILNKALLEGEKA